MSFADFATNAGGGGVRTVSMGLTSNSTGSGPSTLSTSNSFSRPNRFVEAASLKLEQFQRQVLAIKRASTASESAFVRQTRTNTTTTNVHASPVASTNNNALDDDLHDRIRFACLLQEEIAKALRLIPQDPTNSLMKRKLCKDFAFISSQLEAAVLKISAREQAIQDALVQQNEQSKLVVEHQGETLEFAQLDNEIAHNEALIEERERDITKIHQSIAQVHEIFRDLATIVQEQQTAIDDIETHVHESLAQTQQGLAEVKKASEMQSSCVIQ